MTNNSKKRKFLATSLTATMVAAAVAPAAGFAAEAPKLTDIEGHYAEDSIRYLVEKGAIEGKPDGTYAPSETITRGAFAKILAESADHIVVDPNVKADFTDVPEGYFASAHIAALVKAGVVEGVGGDKFDPTGSLSRQSAAKMLVKAYGLELDENADINFSDNNGWGAEYVNIVASLGILEGTPEGLANPAGNLTRGALAALVHRSEVEDVRKDVPQKEVEGLVVESVSAINAKTLQVTFGADVEDVDKLTFNVKRNGVNAQFKVDEVDGKKVTLVRTTGSNLLAGTYEVTVDGLAEGAKNTATVEVEAQAPTSVAIAAESILTNSTKSNLKVQLLDQYGEELEIGKASDYTITVKNLTKDLAGVAQFDTTDKYFYLDTTIQSAVTGERQYAYGDEVQVTVVHNETGLTAKKTLGVDSAAQLSSIEFGELELPEKAKRLSEDVKDVKIPYEAKDQYGNDVELDANLVTLATSDSKVLSLAGDNVTFEKDDKGNKFIKIKKFEKAGNAVLRLVSSQTGEVFNYKLEVLQKAGEVYSVELADTDIDVAEKSGKAYVDVTVTDSYGEKINPKEYLGAYYTINSSNNAIATASFVNNPGNKNHGKLEVDVKSAAKEGDTVQITIKVNKTGETATLNVSIGEKAELASIELVEDHKANLIKGASTKVEFETLDQYGNEFDISGLGYHVSFKASDDKVIGVTKNSDFKYTIDALKAGSSSLTVTIKEDATQDAKTLASKKIDFNVVANNTENLTFAVKDIPTLSKEETNKDGAYAELIEVTAKDANGNDYVIPQEDILSITSSNEDYAKVEKNTDGKWVVYGQPGPTAEPFKDGDATVTLTVVFNAENDVATIKKDVVVSKDAKKATKVEFYDKKPVANKLADKSKAVSTITVDKLDDLQGKKDVFAVVKDQFDRYENAVIKSKPSDYQDVKVDIKNVEGINLTGSVTVDDSDGYLDFSGLTATKASEDTEEASFRIIFTTKNAVVGYINVNISDVSGLLTAEGLADATAVSEEKAKYETTVSVPKSTAADTVIDLKKSTAAALDTDLIDSIELSGDDVADYLEVDGTDLKLKAQVPNEAANNEFTVTVNLKKGSATETVEITVIVEKQA